MELGNLRDAIYGVSIPLGMIFIGSGIIRKRKIVKVLDLGRLKIGEYLKGGLILLGMILVFISLLSPQKVEEERKVEVEGNSIYILVDTSRSMLAEDVYPNRMEAAKKGIKEVVGDLAGDKVGIIPFSSSAYIQMPLTDDYNIAENYVNVIDTKLISGGGTRLLESLKLAERSYRETGSKNKIVLLLSDGGEEEGESIEFAKKNNIKVYSLGIGTKKGGVFPNYEGGVRRGFVKDRDGSTVVSTLNEGFLRKLSRETGGRYYRVDNMGSGAEKIARDISKVSGDKKHEESIKVYAHYYQYPLFVGMIFILLGVVLGGGIVNEED